MLVRWRRLVAFDLGFWTHTLVVGEDHAIAGLRAPSDDLRVAEAFSADSFALCERVAEERRQASVRIWHL
jgi:hypothetical protein